MGKAICFFLWMTVIASVATPPAWGIPANDNFAGAEMLDGPSGRDNGANFGATREAGEPQIGGDPGGRSVWWRWLAPRTEKVTVHTFGSNFDTLLGVYTGGAVSSLELVAQNDDAVIGPGRCGRGPCRRPPPPETSPQSLVAFNAVAGTLYHFAADGLDGESGNIFLTWFQDSGGLPGNDSKR